MLAASTSIPSFIEELERLIANDDPARRAGVLRNVTKLFLERSSLSQDQVDVFDEVISRLARDIGREARIELSKSLAEAPQPPRRVVRQLAFDEDIAVAGPVIARSNGLDDDDLVTLGQERGQEFLLAMSQRPTLSERVADVIVDRGDNEVVGRVAANDGAGLSPHAFGQLLKRRLAASAPRRSSSRAEPPTRAEGSTEADGPTGNAAPLKLIAGGRRD
jgi:uncharacterized protein (DUF2336 family)